ncbi:MAG: hypothetical protein FWF26_06130, partial [Treponema sp.]|nr:hypothetical protein [Treponema sp.]
MDTRLHAVNDARTSFYFERSRLNDLLMEAVRCPVIMVCAGAGYGKTSAVHDFTNMYEADTSWMQLSELDNTGVRFWENFIHTMAKLTEPFARAIGKTGFPDTIDKLNSYQILLHKYIDAKRRILVMDDFYLVKDPSVLRFIEYISNNMPVGVTLILISRSIPGINTANLTSKGLVFNINEDDLRFNENELAQYFHQFDISVPPDGLYEIMQDTEGWAFAINMIARSYQKAPGYNGYLRSAMKSNIFAVMETETWNGISERLQKFLVCLSLISHLSIDLIELLAKEDEELLAELERQNAYIRRDGYINAYLIHPLLLEFLAAKQDLLSGKQKRETYTIAGQWCNRNGFRIDALTYYEKTGNYEKIVSIINEFPYQLPYDIAKFTETILERAPAQAFNEVEDLAVIHIRACMGQGLMQKTIKLAEYYEKKFLGMPG